MTDSSAGGSLLKSIANNSDADSLATRMRRARFSLFLELLDRVDGPVRILDIGGTQEFWNLMMPDMRRELQVTLLNVEQQPVASIQFLSMAGDARSMPEYADKSFDVVFSNSVIEHVGSYEDQSRMAAEVMRVGCRYFVQTPNKRFPMEPHFLVPWFQYLPLDARVALVRRFDVGWYKRIADPVAARREVDSIQLLTHDRFAALFPGSSMHIERFMGLAKSFTAYGGWS